jgi:ABC-2 type transport system permease protein
MRQILIVATKEFKEAFRDKVFLLITVLFLLLSLVSVYIGLSTKHAELKAYYDILGVLKAQGSNAFPVKPQIYPLATLRNIISYISMIGAVLSIFLGFDTFSSERENGTLRLLLSRPVYRDQLLSGKLLGGSMVIGLLIFISFLFNLILFVITSGISSTVVEIGRLAVFMILGFIYMLMFYIVTVYMSIRTRDRAFGFMIMLILWITISFVIPQLAESQKSFAYALNSSAQTVTNLPMDTTISKTIEIFSPTVHFQSIGGDLLQTTQDAGKLGIFDILKKNIFPLIYMLTPGIIVTFAVYRSILKEEI